MAVGFSCCELVEGPSVVDLVLSEALVAKGVDIINSPSVFLGGPPVSSSGF